ncbi:MAG: DUF3793 family protein [Eubacteriales bacterium]|nr:DUF3793 family protein [Eubacteriales bacterium]
MSKEPNAKLEMEIARQCAPVLAGLKPSNLLILEDRLTAPRDAFPEGAGLSARLLYQGPRKSIWLVYRRVELERVLALPEIREFLKEWGYSESCMDCMLRRLAARFAACREKKQAFPHEMGVFLGYPLGDVKGFITYGGKNYLYSGYWKVYENVEETKKQFQLFEAVKTSLTEAVRNGMGIWGALQERLPQPV